ncbi:MAG: hypothetical protein IPP31_13325 [Chitinophagaceae bacterium]|nr:hypothetical protein [Chitinophagaceae bacterium]
MSRIEKELFGKIGEHDVLRFNLSNERGNGVSILNYGGIINAWMIGGKNIVTGFNHMEDYRDNPAFFGCLVGRYANRIANGCFTIDGLDYSLACNNAGHHLHGGEEGFNKRYGRPRSWMHPSQNFYCDTKVQTGRRVIPVTWNSGSSSRIPTRMNW